MSQRVRIGGLLAFALLLRLLSNHWLTAVPPVLNDDAQWYHTAAVSMAEGRGYVHHFTQKPTAAWPPGYPALLAILYRMLGPDPAWAFALNAVAGTVTCWLTGRLAGELVSPRAQVAATALMAVAPSHVLFASLALSETVFTTLLAGLVLISVALLRDEARSRQTQPADSGAWLGWGIATGLASLVRAEAVVLLAVPALAMALSRRPLRRVAAATAAAALGLLVGQAPWLIRNAMLFGGPVPVSTSFGRTMLIGHNPEADGGMNLYSPDEEADRRDLASGDPARELAVDRRLRNVAVEFAVTHPAVELVLVARRLREMYRGDRAWAEWYEPGVGAGITPADIENLGRLSNLFYWPLLLLAAPALVRALRTMAAPRLALPVVLISWTAFFAVVLYGSQRFHFPLLPLFVVLATDTLLRIGKPPTTAPPAS